ncbi:MAG TPA: 4Fe-4S binding protein [Deltaproteobacteria bacterium]|nr:4Fe-4S binding protein [Deltaproteobacteria bacterium]
MRASGFLNPFLKLNTSHLKLSFIRKLCQALFLLLFLFLFIQTQSKGFDTLGYPVRIFLDFDPLILISTFLAGHAVSKAMPLALITILLTVALGRVFCGWICPLGTLNNMMGAFPVRRKAVPAGLFRLKYYLLFVLLAGSLFSLQLSGLFDPISILIRSFTLSVYPLLNRAAMALLGAADNLGGAGFTDQLYERLRGGVLAFTQPYYLQSVFVGLIFAAILLANLVQKRFWCRFLCPLGALLGLLGRFSMLGLEVSEGCATCGACALHCQGDAVTDGGRGRRPSECLVCFDCDDPCPSSSVGYGRRAAHAALDLPRRGVITSLASGMLLAPFLRLSPPVSNPLLIRPPGARPEPEFLKRCVKCGECMKVCITGGLQPTLLEAGLEGIWTPRLVPRIGYCEFHCTLCGQVCPTGAIGRLAREDKVKVKIGLAMIDKSRCLPHSHAMACIACQEVCPTSPKAVWLEEAEAKSRDGAIVRLNQPHIDLQRCIGCGICEKVCPVADRPAVYITSLGESRSPGNQLS